MSERYIQFHDPTMSTQIAKRLKRARKAGVIRFQWEMNHNVGLGVTYRVWFL